MCTREECVPSRMSAARLLMWHHETKWTHYIAFLKFRLKPFWLLRRCIFHQFYLHHLCHSSTYRGYLRRFRRLLFGTTNHSTALTLMLLSLKIFVGRLEFQFFSFLAQFLQRHCRRRPDRRQKSRSHSRELTKVAERDLKKIGQNQFNVGCYVSLKPDARKNRKP